MVDQSHFHAFSATFLSFAVKATRTFLVSCHTLYQFLPKKWPVFCTVGSRAPWILPPRNKRVIEAAPVTQFRACLIFPRIFALHGEREPPPRLSRSIGNAAGVVPCNTRVSGLSDLSSRYLDRRWEISFHSDGSVEWQEERGWSMPRLIALMLRLPRSAAS